MDCVFCAIRDGREAASVVHEDELALVFRDLYPINEGHLLVVPKAHATELAELDPATGGPLFRLAQESAARLRESGIRCEGVNLFLADGTAAGQDVFHVHLHVLPRFAGDNFAVEVPRGFGAPERAQLDTLAARIRF